MIAKITCEDRVWYTTQLYYSDFFGHCTDWDKMSISNAERLNCMGKTDVGYIKSYLASVDYVEDSITLIVTNEIGKHFMVKIYESLTWDQQYKLEYG